MTKANENRLDSYEWYTRRYGFRTLWEAYDRPSHSKESAYDYCLDLMKKKNGYGGSVLGANTFVFSYGFKYTDENGKEHLMFITRDNDYDFIID